MGRVTLALTTALLLAGITVPASAAGVAEGLTIIDPAKIDAHPDDEGIATQTVTVRNDGPAITKLLFTFVGDRAATVTSPNPSSIAANGVARFKLTIGPSKPSKTASGQLVASAEGRPPGTVPTTISPKETVPAWVSQVIFIPLIGALAFVLLAWITLSARGELDDNLGPVDWDFSKSWASNLTVFSALLGTILAAGVLPKETSTARTATYAGLNLLFGLGVLVGPFLYTAFQTGVEVHKRGKLPELQHQGKIWAFLLASVVTLGATAGEFATIWKLFGQLHTAGSLPDAGLVAFEVLIGVAGFSLIALAWRRLRAILRSQSAPAKANLRGTRHQQLLRMGVTDLPESKVKPELEPWPAF